MVIALTTTTISAPRTTFMVAPPPSLLRIHVGWPESTADVTLRPLGVGERDHNADQEDPRGEQQLEPLVLPSSQQQSQRHQKADVGDPARQAGGA